MAALSVVFLAWFSMKFYMDTSNDSETEAYVAFGTEYRALVDLPGIKEARVFEPEPAKVYLWERD